MTGLFVVGLTDVVDAFRRSSLGCLLGWQDIRHRYRRSSFGPFWLTLSMGVMIGTMGVVFANLFNSPVEEFFPYLAIGLILWNYISSVVNESCTAFTSSDSIIRQLPLPLFVHIIRVVWRATIIFFHNIVIVPIVLLVLGKSVNFSVLLALPGFASILINLAWMSLLLATICARYRDFPQMVSSMLQVVFYVTPIMWMPRLLEGRTGASLIVLNPVFHMVEVVRGPILGIPPEAGSWTYLLVMATVGWVGTLLFYGRYRARIAYWL